MARLRSISVAMASLLLPACSLLFDPSELSDGDGGIVADASDASADAEPMDPVWGCLGNVVSPPEDRAVPIDVEFTFTDIAGTPLPDVSGKLCKFIDIGCQSPLESFVSDQNGKITLPLYFGFRGYLDMAPSEAHPDLLPSLIYVPLLEGIRVQYPQFLMNLGSTLQLSYITQQAGRPADPELGHIAFVAYDCRSAPAPDVKASVDPAHEKTYPFFFDRNSTPSLNLDKTSELGTGGFINVPPGVVEMSYEREGRRVGSQNVIVRAGSITILPADPTP